MKNLAVITGGTRGLGLALAQIYCAHDYKTLAIYKSKIPENLDERITAVQFDISKGPFDFTPLPEFDSITIIHNACADFQPTSFHLIAHETYRAQFEVGPIGLFNLLHPGLRLARKTKQLKFAVILSEALVLDTAPKGFSHYVGAKRAMESIVDSLDSEYRGRNISFFKFYPPYMETALVQGWPKALRNTMAPQPIRDVAQSIFDRLES